MLAEPRRRQKWCLNPRGTLWSNDEDKLGQKLLEKMGWKKGKGLGKNEDGDPEHLRISYKNDSKGMGFKGSDDNWIAHQDDFGALLNQLNDEHGSSPSDSNKSSEVDSLEKRSKLSKKRVHYHKFTRGKDLSKYSCQDISSILGKRESKKLEVPQEEQSSKVDDSAANFQACTMNFNNYFNQKIKKLKGGGDLVTKFESVEEVRDNDEEFLLQPFKNGTNCAADKDDEENFTFVPFRSENSFENDIEKPVKFKDESPVKDKVNVKKKKKKCKKKKA